MRSSASRCRRSGGWRRSRASALLIAAFFTGRPAAGQELSAAQRRTIPTWALAAVEAPAFATVYRPSARLDPFLLRGDFDGDGQQDLALLVSRRDSGAQGIAFLHAESSRIVVVGAGHALGNGGDDFSWMDAWNLYPRAAGAREAGAPASPAQRGDAVLVEKLESASAVIYWDGTGYRWQQRGD